MSEVESNPQRKHKERKDFKPKEDEKSEKEQHAPEITQIIDPILLMDEILEKLKLLNYE